jgi:hypothetical protein
MIPTDTDSEIDSEDDLVKFENEMDEMIMYYQWMYEDDLTISDDD